MREIINCWVELPDICFFSYEESFDLFSSTIFKAGSKILIKTIEGNEEEGYIVKIKTKGKEGIWYGLIRRSSWFDKLKILSKEHKKVKRLA